MRIRTKYQTILADICHLSRLWGSLLLLTMLVSTSVHAQRVRAELSFPDLEGFQTLKCDFHMHTVYSDGSVWPSIRPEEAWREGLDVIAITDHLEYLPHQNDLTLTNYHRSFDLAKGTADQLGILLIKSAELTRGEPPGHFNLLFLENINAIPTNDHRAALRAAQEQGAFVFWNHPGWKQKAGQSVWYDEQQEAFTNGWLQGIEIVNGRAYDPIAHQWCLDKNLTVVGNSDVHGTIHMDYSFPPNNHRPITLVFATKKSVEGVKEALLERRTAVYFQNQLIGAERFLTPLFNRSLIVKTPRLKIGKKGRGTLQVFNHSPLDLELKANGRVEGLTYPGEITLYAGKTVALDVRRTDMELAAGTSIELPYAAQNLLIAPDQPLPAQIKFTLNPK